ncbi:hypothetical protein VB714_06005 [Spirulina sp. 06S082]|nr:hypothetical protein [Spirulina sp. 06S082]
MDKSTLISPEQQSRNDHILDSGWDREEQLKTNQKAMKLLKAMIERNQSKKTTEEDLRFWQFVYETIDSHRPMGQKLFSEKS